MLGDVEPATDGEAKPLVVARDGQAGRVTETTDTNRVRV